MIAVIYLAVIALAALIAVGMVFGFYWALLLEVAVAIAVLCMNHHYGRVVRSGLRSKA